MRAGDTLRVHVLTLACEESSKPVYGTLRFEYSVRNQDDVEVMNFVVVMLAHRRAEGAVS